MTVRGEPLVTNRPGVSNAWWNKKKLKYVSDEIELLFNYTDQDKSMNIFADNVSIKMYG